MEGVTIVDETFDPRYDVPIFTIGEAAQHLRMPAETLRRWVNHDDLVTSLRPQRVRDARLPFIAMAEAQFFLQLRRDGLSLQAITSGMAAVRAELGDRMLQRNRIAHNGKDILMRLDDPEASAAWERARDRQGGLEGVIERGLKPITWAEDGFPARVRLTAYEAADVVIDPRFVFGKPMLADRGVRTQDVLDMFLAGDSIQEVADEFAIEPAIVESIVRTHGLAA